jgi:sugar O-acyltransferase (sialic acid O-acetyltransferase NeuD family)
MSERLLIVGAGAQARYILNTTRLSDKYEVIGLIDTFNNPALWGKEVDGARVLGGIDTLTSYPPANDLKVICAIADVKTKKQIVRDMEQAGYEFCNIVHPAVLIAENVVLAKGIIINAGVVIECGTSIGNHVIIHAGCVVEHDNILEDYVNLGPGVTTAGRVRIGAGAIVYTGATLIPDVAIGENSVVGAGAVVIRSVAPNSKVAGVPAKPITPPQ